MLREPEAPTRMKSTTPPKLAPKTLERTSQIMLALNAFGAACWLLIALFLTLGPRDRAMGIEEFSGPLFVLGLISLEFFGGPYLILNLIWGGLILAYRYWRGGRLWFIATEVWLVAYAIYIAYARGYFDRILTKL
jgi:hypothetical protein